MIIVYIKFRQLFKLGFIYLASIILLTGCAVIDFEKPIKDMAAAVDLSVDSINKLDQNLTAYFNDGSKKKIVGEKLFLKYSEKNCRPDLSGCSLGIYKSVAGELVLEERSFPVKSLIPRSRVALAGLKKYVANLQAIVESDKAGEVTTSANTALANIANENNATGIKDNGKKESEESATFSHSGIDAIRWLTGRYIEYYRIRALRTVTSEAHPVVKNLENIYKEIQEAATENVRLVADGKFMVAEDNYDTAFISKDLKTREEAIDSYVKAAAEYDHKLRASGSLPLQAFVDAHSKLMMHLNKKNVSFSDVLGAIENFVAKANEFKEIVEKSKGNSDQNEENN